MKQLRNLQEIIDLLFGKSITFFMIAHSPHPIKPLRTTVHKLENGMTVRYFTLRPSDAFIRRFVFFLPPPAIFITGFGSHQEVKSKKILKENLFLQIK